jgi:PAS domain S-box-containing protein
LQRVRPFHRCTHSTVVKCALAPRRCDATLALFPADITLMSLHPADGGNPPEQRHIRQRDALLALMMAPADASVDAAFHRITEVAARTLGVARVSIWRYDAGCGAIRCVDLYEADSGRHSSGAELTAVDHPKYFAALARTEVIAADDAHTDARTAEFSASYLAPLGIASMLDAPVHLHGTTDGVLCHEHVGAQRHWHDDEKTFALALANLVALALEAGERRAAERALRDSERHLRAIVDGTPSYFALMSPDGTLIEANRAALAFAPALLARAIGRKIWDTAWFTLTPGLSERVRRIVAKATAGHTLRRVVAMLDPAGRTMHFEFTTMPMLDEDGRVVLLLAEGRDVTERRRAEAREHELEAQLLQVQKMESLGTLAGGIAHDFNNILAAILGNAQLARDGLPREHALHAQLEQISVSGRRARGLVQQILAFSRRDTQELHVQPLQPLVAETLQMLRATLPSRVRLEQRLAEAPLHVCANATQLQQVLMNVGTNAWHALPEAGGCIEVGLRAAEVGGDAPVQLADLPRGRCVHLWVTDSGSGMDEATLQRIFEPFFTTKPVGQGTGLGLSVAHGIVAAHGGAVMVRSRPGAGTTVDVYLPLADAVPAAADAGRCADTPAPAGRGQHVMYIDDDPVMAPVAEGLLRRAGYRVSAFVDARAALQRLRDDPAGVDIVVTDYNMPDMSGLAVARELAALRPALPVIITSGFIDEELRRGSAQPNVRLLLHKEVACDQLGPAVGRVLAPAA